MKRLSLYLVGQFARDSVALFAIMLALMWMAQWLRLFDVVSGKGQSMLTLFGQAALSLPPLAVVFLYATIGIGLGRALVRLQANQELHIIHASRQVAALVKAVGLYALGAAIAVFLIANFLAPASTHELDLWRARVAADLVSRSIVPHRFTEIVPGVIVEIGGRRGAGEITDFFADDRRIADEERTYIAKSARVGEDDQGYVLQLADGVLQYRSGGELSQISFERYDLAVEKLTAGADPGNLDAWDSLTLLRRALVGDATPGIWPKLVARADEVVRVFAICLFVLALTGLPHARRGRMRMPIELTVLLAAFLERGVTEYAPLPPLLAPLSGALLLLCGSGLLLAWRLRVFRPAPMRRASA